ncbi:PREDICTED: probable H/ACA ribonucleoprotein complex subunit 4 isoform X1 [Camelina sativa]|uniref:Probable H/ACA ribonucleoprotein complex subunit 4 isoform X1 n=1 Tax=Camelina sativa TaxID=90675 RepID=A0ABM0YZ36_CAMSA|nr:PREDICTED: probable H/ACA ribonucleoprotein complex subunit 4 isoform X1 [Camelina sativa]
MGGKGKKRREKNYLAAHGGPARLPPPPDRSKQDALPSKLRILMNYTSPSPHDSTKQVVVEKKLKNTKAEVDATVAATATESDEDDTMVMKGDEKKKKKRKRNQMSDLRFEKELAELDGQSKRKERKKKYWEAKKQKKNQVKTEDTLREDFPKHEQIRFGDVVQAPPKLAVVPKARKSTLSASQERQRLEAIDAYRSRKGWTERPGTQIPAVVMQ